MHSGEYSTVFQSAKMVFKKDFFLEKSARVAVMAFGGVGFVLMMLSLFIPDLPFMGAPGLEDVAVSVQTFMTLSTTGIFIIPLVLSTSVIQGEKRSGSFVLYRTLPLDLSILVWARIFACWCSAILPLLIMRLGLEIAWLTGSHQADLFWVTARSFSFLVFICSMGFVLSAFGVGLAMWLSPQVLPVAVSLVSSVVVLFPFVFSRKAMGVDSGELVVAAASVYSPDVLISLVLLLVGLLIGGCTAWAVTRKRSYV